MTGCPSENELAAFLEGRLPPDRAARCDEHIDACKACFLLYGALGGTAEEPPELTQISAALAQTAAQSPAPEFFDVPATFDEFRLLRPLGRGAMGQVYLGHDTLLDRSVAIKFLSDSQPDQVTRERFLTEARAVARLQHPNVAAAYRFGEVQGRPYLVSEFIQGQSLEKLPKPLQWQQVLRIGLGLARGLEVAHQRGVLHRDIKPANAILASDGQVKLLDFGLAKMLERQPGVGESLPGQEVAGSPDLTGAGSVVGTPVYLAPELWDGEPASRRSDLYALGALLYDLCSGQPPHLHKTLKALRRAAREEDARPLVQVAPGVEPRLAGLIDRCLHRQPTERFASAAELLQALEALQADATAREVARATLPRRLRRGGALLCGAALLTCSIAMVARWYQHAQRVGMADIPGGTLRMGSTPQAAAAAFLACQSEAGGDCEQERYDRERPEHPVYVAPFRLDRTEVTSAAFAAWLNQRSDLRLVDDPSPPPVPGRFVYEGDTLLADLHPRSTTVDNQDGRFVVRHGDAEKPITNVTWEAARRYCSAHGGRLPTEAEWEMAARGVEGRRYPWGDEPPTCAGVVFGRAFANACKGSSAPERVGASPLDRTPLGVWDMGGNVSEWVADRWAPYAPCTGVCPDPGAAGDAALPVKQGAERVFRGGNWNLPASALRVAARSHLPDDTMMTNIGFRCAAQP